MHQCKPVQYNKKSHYWFCFCLLLYLFHCAPINKEILYSNYVYSSLLKVFLTSGMIGTIIAIVRGALENESPVNHVLVA